MTCKTVEELEAEALAAKNAAEAARIALEKARRAEDDNTDVNVAPIGVTNDTSTVILEGLFFNMQGGFREEDIPANNLTIKKDVLDRSSGFFEGRFQYDIDARAKVVFEVYMDGVPVDKDNNFKFGTGLPYNSGIGYMDPTLFKYPNTAKAGKAGAHKVHVYYGLITGIAESALGLLDWGKVHAQGDAVFTINLLPNGPRD
ncbi:MAG: hypothetical protein WC294_11115 [Methanoregula sp.]|jgi:hypothetical protein